MLLFKKSSAWIIAILLGAGLSLGGSNTARATSGQAKAWAIISGANNRFVPYPLSNGALLHDRETGLVWTSSVTDTQANTPNNTSIRYTVLSHQCRGHGVTVDGETVRGFRLPSVEELTNISRHLSAFTGIETGPVVYVSSTMSLQIVPTDDKIWEGGTQIKPEYFGVQFVGNSPQILRCELNQRVSDSTDGLLHCPTADVSAASFATLCVRGGGSATDYHMNDAHN